MMSKWVWCYKPHYEHKETSLVNTGFHHSYIIEPDQLPQRAAVAMHVKWQHPSLVSARGLS
jgi:hypothetical protein